MWGGLLKPFAFQTMEVWLVPEPRNASAMQSNHPKNNILKPQRVLHCEEIVLRLSM